MRPDPTPLLRALARRAHQRRTAHNDLAAQRRLLGRLLERGARTRFGAAHGLETLLGSPDGAAFRRRVPLRSYDSLWEEWLAPHWPAVTDVLIPGTIPFYALTSGSTRHGSKRLPLTRGLLHHNHRAARAVIAAHLTHHPESALFGGPSLMLAGSSALAAPAPGVREGDLSGIVMARQPWWARPFSHGAPATHRLADWDAKLDRLAAPLPAADLRSLSGTPGWLLMLFDRAAAQHGGTLADWCPQLALLVHGGVDFTPYRPRFQALTAPMGTDLREVYTASEGFFAYQDTTPEAGLRLLTDHGVFYEFVPVDRHDAPDPPRLTLADVRVGEDYALVVTTEAGLWAHRVGDVVRFVSTQPPRLVISGRTDWMVSVEGEHLSGGEMEQAVAAESHARGRTVTEWTVAARAGPPPDHHYVIEWAEGPLPPEGLAAFAHGLDARLQAGNDDYRTHRGLSLPPPQVTAVAPGTFIAWMRARGRLGGQNKVPRVLQNPDQLENLLIYASTARNAQG